jgi:small subunit ribosomal protein S11e
MYLMFVRFVSFFKAVGLGFKTPLEAKEGTYIDKKCPWTGNISIRGKLLRGVVVSTKMKRYLSLHIQVSIMKAWRC